MTIVLQQRHTLIPPKQSIHWRLSVQTRGKGILTQTSTVAVECSRRLVLAWVSQGGRFSLFAHICLFPGVLARYKGSAHSKSGLIHKVILTDFSTPFPKERWVSLVRLDNTSDCNTGQRKCSMVL